MTREVYIPAGLNKTSTKNLSSTKIYTYLDRGTGRPMVATLSHDGVSFIDIYHPLFGSKTLYHQPNIIACVEKAIREDEKVMEHESLGEALKYYDTLADIKENHLGDPIMPETHESIKSFSCNCGD